jgi:hypothetical protein
VNKPQLVDIQKKGKLELYLGLGISKEQQHYSMTLDLGKQFGTSAYSGTAQ